MAKGRKLTTSRSQRLLGSYSHSHSSGSSAADSLELGEDDVWSMVDNMAGREGLADNNSEGAWVALASVELSGGFSIRTRRRIPKDASHVGGLSLALEDSSRATSPRILHQLREHQGLGSPRGHNMATSAPMKVPDWTKILREESLKESEYWVDDEDLDIVPPHEYLAARSQKSSATSVFEGAGRTLKGRDMRRVRDAVWSQTGFDG